MANPLAQVSASPEPHGRADARPSQLRWINVAGLGIAFAVSGSFSGWNVGLGLGGWGGMLIAAVVMACFYLGLTQSIAELAAACPGGVQGMDSLAGMGLGDAGRFFAGISIAIAVGGAVGAGATFIEAYSQSVFGLGGTWLKLALIAGVIGIQLRGAREAVSLTMAGGFVSVAVLAVFCASLAPDLTWQALLSTKSGTPSLLPNGIAGALQCIPYALFMFLGVEQAANAAGDMHQPARSLPKAIFAAVATILLVGVAVLVASAAGGVDRVAAADGDPLYVAITGAKGAGTQWWLETAVGAGSVLALLSTVFSLAYASSAQFRSLAEGGLLPPILGRVNTRGAPSHALVAVAALAWAGTLVDANTVLVCFIFGLGVCNVLVLISFLLARRRLAGLSRPYRAIGGEPAAWVTLVLAVAVLAACVQLQPMALAYVLLAYSVLAVFFLLSRKRLS